MVSENGLEALKLMYDALNGGSPFPELECSGSVLKELTDAGLINYNRGFVSITSDGENYLEEQSLRGS